LSGPVLGALVLIPLQQYFYLQFGNANLYLIAYGVLFILILRLLPGGIVPGVTKAWRGRLVARARARQEPAGGGGAGPQGAGPPGGTGPPGGSGPKDSGPEDTRPGAGQKDRA
jgi:hypothetical protein